jgi:hypothetical protein
MGVSIASFSCGLKVMAPGLIACHNPSQECIVLYPAVMQVDPVTVQYAVVWDCLWAFIGSIWCTTFDIPDVTGLRVQYQYSHRIALLVHKCSNLCPHEQLAPLLQFTRVLQKCQSGRVMPHQSLLTVLDINLMPLHHRCFWHTATVS